jgi:ABC-2 type transport system ATP-binding protein
VLRQYAAFYASPLDPVDLLEQGGLTSRARSSWRSLSGGEKQRLSLALALVGRPRVAFLDEPSAGIDMEGRLLIREVLKSLKADGVCVVLTTHDLDDVERSADRIVILDHGKVVADGTPDSLLGSSQNEYVVFGAEPGLSLGILGAALGMPIDETTPGEYRVDQKPTPELFARIAAVMAEQEIALRDIRAGRQRLDDLFLQLTRERSTAELPVIDSGRTRK